MRLHERQQSLRSRTLVIGVLFSVVCSVLFLPVSFVHAGISSVINEFLFDIAYSLGGILVSASGWALDGALKELVFGMGTLMNGGLGISINTVWVIVRDGFNLLFIFGLIFIGLKLIWNYDDSRAKGTLVTLIIAALLINFSLFIAKFIVDFSNIAALQIFNMMGNTLAVQPVGGAPTLFNAWDGGIAGYVLHLVGLASLGNIESAASGFGVAIMVFIFLLFTALVFLAGAFLLVTRFVMLSFYMIFSPVMFLGLILPKMKSMQDRWWDGFLKQAFFAPAYLFCVYIALRILAGTKEAISKGGQLSAGVGELGGAGNGVFTGAANSPGFMTILFLIISLGFMIAAVLVANKMSIHGASGSMMMIKGARSRLQRGMGNATAGGAAALTRNTVGRASYNKLGDKEYVASKSASWAGRQQLKAMGAMADSSFDARKVGGVGKQLDIGEGRKGGYTTVVKEKREADEKFAKSLGTVDESDVRVQARMKEKEAAEIELKRVKTQVEQEKRENNDEFKRKTEPLQKEQEEMKKQLIGVEAVITSAQQKMQVAEQKLAAAQQTGDVAQIAVAESDLKSAKSELTGAQQIKVENGSKIEARQKEIDSIRTQKINADLESEKKITTQEKKINEANVLVENEKNRFVLGSTFTTPESNESIATAKATLKAKQDEIDQEWTKYSDKNDAATNEKVLAAIAAKNAELAALKNLEQNARARGSVTGQGLAASLDSRGSVKSYQKALTALDRTATTGPAALAGAKGHYEYLGNQSADNLRKKYEKQAKMSKEDKQNATLAEAFKSSK